MSILKGVNNIEYVGLEAEIGRLEDVNISNEDLILGLESVYAQLEGLEITADLEGLVSRIIRLSLGVIDTILGIVNNANIIVQGIVKAVPKSELQTSIAKHRTKFSVLKKAEYSKIAHITTPTFPFAINPLETSLEIGKILDSISMKPRIIGLLRVMDNLNRALKNSDIDRAVKVIKEVNTLTIRGECDTTTKKISGMVISKLPSNYEEFGTRYPSVGRFLEVIDDTTKRSNELNTLRFVADRTKVLHRFMKELKRHLTRLSGDDVDIAQLKVLPATLFNIGKLLATYAITVKEYHHLEHNLAMTLGIVVVDQFSSKK